MGKNMPAQVIKFPKKRNVLQEFRGWIGLAKEDFDYSTEQERAILNHTLSAMINIAHVESKALRYYFKAILGYNTEEMAKVVDKFIMGEIFLVLASKFLAQQWLEMEKLIDA